MKTWTPWRKPTENTTFGLSFNVETRKDLIVVCSNRGQGWTPEWVLLPHQLYREDVEKMLKEDSDIRAVVVFPVRAEGYQTIYADHPLWLSKKEAKRRTR